jgi:ketosteroid isomerase-like protein
MEEATAGEAPLAVLARLNAAMNRRDLNAFVACFDRDYQSEQPAHPDRQFRGAAQVERNWSAMFHPDRQFRGAAQVERNWSAMFAALADFRAEVLRCAAAEDSAWVEWRWTGTRADGSRLEACGACIFGVRAGRIVWGRLYMEEVETGQGIEDAVTQLATADTTHRAKGAAGPAG